MIPKKLTQILHGSCRNAHHPAKDSLVSSSHWQAVQRSNEQQGAQLLLLSGDQIYADDVAGPMLLAIHQLIKQLGIYKEQPLDLDLPAEIAEQLYGRHYLLPTTSWKNRSKENHRTYRSYRKPVSNQGDAGRCVWLFNQRCWP